MNFFLFFDEFLLLGNMKKRSFETEKQLTWKREGNLCLEDGKGKEICVWRMEKGRKSVFRVVGWNCFSRKKKRKLFHLIESYNLN
jgi:hypothetical protein